MDLGGHSNIHSRTVRDILVEVTVHQFNKYIYREFNIYHRIRSGAKLNELNRRESLALLKTRI